MPNPKAVARGKTFFERILAKIPEDKRSNFSELLSNEELLEEAGNDGLRQDEFSRLTSGVKAEEAKLVTHRQDLLVWQKKKLEEIAAARVLEQKVAPYAERLIPLIEAGKIKSFLDQVEAGGDWSGGGDTQQLPSDLVRKGELRTAIEPHLLAFQKATLDQGMGAVAYMQKISNEHWAEFQKPLDTVALTRFCQERKVGFDVGYAAYVAEAREERQAEVQKTREAELIEQGRTLEREARLAETPEMPYEATPLALQPHLAHVLARGGDKALDKSQLGVDAAVAHFNRLRTTKAS